MATHSSRGPMATQLRRVGKLISEPTNFESNTNPSCIDLVTTDQPNLVLDCGTRASLDSFCHREITYCKVNFNIPPPPPYKRKIWHYDRTNIPLLKEHVQIPLASTPEP